MIDELHDLPNEIWKQIPGCPGYEVSNLGRVKSYKKSKPYLMRPTDQEGYLHLAVVKQDGKYFNTCVHVLVALAFIGPCPEGAEVCHGDGNRRNNHPDNLRYDTHGGNIDDLLFHRRLARWSRRAARESQAG